MEHGVLPPELMVDPRDAMGAVLARDKHSELMPIDAIGRAVGAEVVIYIEMLGFTELGGQASQPQSAVTVRVIDCVNRMRLFPPADQQTPHVVQANTTQVDPSTMASPSARLKIYQLLAENTGDRIAKMFYRHEVRELGDRLGPH
jgi:hypothetical protein